jgi:uncharacterized protein YjeT (DUF2065 family)
VQDLLTAVALILIFEGAAYALFTQSVKQALTSLLAMSDELLQKFAWVALAAGLVLLAFLRF